jgi:uncharacterized RDD family membrane protein YckC
VVLVLYVVPVLGFLVYKLLGMLGLGAVVYTLILAARAHRAAQGDPAARTAGAPPSIIIPAPVMTPPTGTPPTGTPPTGTPPAGTAPAGTPPPPGTASPPGIASAGGAAAAPPVTAALPRAGFWIRMVALLIDALLVGFVMGVLHVYHLELLVLAAYGAVMWKLRGSTIGGIVFDLRVVRFDDRPLDWETAIVRALGCFLSLAVAGLGFIWIAFDANNQAWHDKIAGTLVVRVPKGVPLV